MSILIAIITLALLVVAVLVVTAPLRAARAERGRELPDADSAQEQRERSAIAALTRDELQSAREAKYREIRDAELDYRTGKLSREDYEAVDGDLRAEAIEILDRIEHDDAPG